MKSKKEKDTKIKQNDENINEQTKADEYLAGWQRAKADFMNYKKRQEETMADFKKYVKESSILEILLILDNFNEALKYIPQDNRKSEWIQGILNIKKQFDTLLKQYGAKEIKTVGEKFNPEFHEAVEVIESDKETGIVIEEGQKGYTLNGKVIRAAKVKVSK